MAQQLPIVTEPTPSNYRELYLMVGYQAGEPDPAQLVASYRFSEVPGTGKRPTPANLKQGADLCAQ